jgi:hypothetical protein
MVLKREVNVEDIYNAQAILIAGQSTAGVEVGQPFELKISQGMIEGYSWVDKFGENPEVDTSSDPEDLWEFGGIYIYDADGTAPMQYISSSDVLDTGQTIEISGLDIDGLPVTQTITTNGQTNVTLATPLWRVFRMENESDFGSEINGILYFHIDPAPTSGVPLSTAVRAIINNGNNQTQMLLYTIPVGFVGFIRRGKFSISRAQSTGTAQCAYYSRRFGKVWKNKERFDVVANGSSQYTDLRPNWDIVPAKTDIRVSIEEVSSNGTGVSGSLQILLVEESKLIEAYKPLAQ